MNGFKLVRNAVVIMDGTNKNNVRYITDMIREWSLLPSFEPEVYQMDKDHPSMIVVKADMFLKDRLEVNNRIEARFPGLCIFNPPMAV